MSTLHEAGSKPRMTAEQYFAMPEGGPRCELIHGELIEMTPSPNSRHQDVVGSLYAALRAHVRARALGRVMIAPLDAYLSDRDVVQPDLLFMSNERSARLVDRVRGAPDLVVEVLSPSTRRHDLREKLEIYGASGVIEAWYVDPEIERVEVYRFAEAAKKPVKTLIRGETLASTLFPDFQPTIDAILDATL